MQSGTIQALGLTCALTTMACQPAATPDPESGAEAGAQMSDIGKRLAKYTSVQLTSDLSGLSDHQRRMIPFLIEAAQAMDSGFWRQAYGDKEALLASLDDPELRRYAEINYGPWDRLEGNEPFLEGVGQKPPGAAFYPADMTREELDQVITESPGLAATLKGLYTVVERDAEGKLTAVPYSQAYGDLYRLAAEKLRAGAELAEDAGFRTYLELRANALLTDDYYASDLAWMDMKSNAIDIVIGPIETYEDRMFGAKASSEAYVLIKDRAWSERLAKYAAMLPSLQRGLPVTEEYKRETPGSNSDLGVYDVVYYAGDCNAGSKTIAINLPNDERVQLQKGSRRLQLKNAMRAKFDRILLPISELLIDAEQRSLINFDAFFENTMFHEVAHGLGIKATISGKGTVRAALQNHASALEEGKADVLGLYMLNALHQQGDLDGEIEDNYVTFMASIFRSIRFGAASAHGLANLIRFNFFHEMGAFSRDEATGVYRVDFDQLAAAADALSQMILRLQGDGDYRAVAAFVAKYESVGETLASDLARLDSAAIPVDVVFEQGVDVLGL